MCIDSQTHSEQGLELYLGNFLSAALSQSSIRSSVGPQPLHARLQGREAVCTMLPQRSNDTVNEVDLQLALHPLVLGIHVQGWCQP